MNSIRLLASAILACTVTTASAAFLSTQNADVIIGRQLPDATQINYPYATADRMTNKVYVADRRLHRILRFSSGQALQNGSPAEAVLGQPDFTSSGAGTGPNRLNAPQHLWCDDNGNLWVADSGNHRVLRFDAAYAKPSGANADGVLGQVNFQNNTPGLAANRLDGPFGVVTDAFGDLYVSDRNNNRVLRFDSAASKPNGAAAIGVLGQINFTTGAQHPTQTNRMTAPGGLAVVRGAGASPVNTMLWVADPGNNRILLWTDANHAVNGGSAQKVLGQPNFTTNSPALTQGGFEQPISLACDLSGRLYAGDFASRVLRFDNAINKPNGANADAILGQALFTTSATGSGPGHLHHPGSLALDGTGRLWIGDHLNNRVLRHDAPELKPNGADADGVLGAPSTTADLSRIVDPMGIAIDPTTGKLFVSDMMRHRVLRFSSVQSLASGAGAEAVFGQSSFAGSAPATTAAGMTEPTQLAMTTNGVLWVADRANNRVLRFNNASNRPSGVAADAVLGQPNFTTSSSVISAASIEIPTALATGPNGELWVVDRGHSRILRFDFAATKGTGAAADGVLGQADFVSEVFQIDGAHIVGACICADNSGRIWVGDYVSRRILRFDDARNKPPYASADAVLGQADFVSTLDTGTSPDGVNPLALMVEPGGRLWACDGNNDRLLRWESAATAPNGADAAGLMGQQDFGVHTEGSAANEFSLPTGIARDSSGRIWVADRSNQRVMRFTPVTPGITAQRKDATTITVKYENLARGVHYRRQSSTDLQFWQEGFLTPAADGATAIDVTISPGGRQYFRLIEP